MNLLQRSPGAADGLSSHPDGSVHPRVCRNSHERNPEDFGESFAVQGEFQQTSLVVVGHLSVCRQEFLFKKNVPLTLILTMSVND